jgi:hypothetical protein
MHDVRHLLKTKIFLDPVPSSHFVVKHVPGVDPLAIRAFLPYLVN